MERYQFAFSQKIYLLTLLGVLGLVYIYLDRAALLCMIVGFFFLQCTKLSHWPLLFLGMIICLQTPWLSATLSKLKLHYQVVFSNIDAGVGCILSATFYAIYHYLFTSKIARAEKKVVAGEGIVLGTDWTTQEPVTLSHSEANHHTLAVGTTGTGKTTSICNVVEAAIEQNIGLFYIDGKGDLLLASKISKYAKSHNRKFYLFSMVGDSCAYNPLASGGFTAKKDRLVELRTWSEEYYRKIAENYLQVVLSIMETLKIPVDLATLAKYLDLEELFIIARNQRKQDLLDKLAQIEKYGKEVQGLVVEINNLVNSEIGHLFDVKSANTLTLEQAYAENAIVYFCLSPLAFPSYSATIGKLVINDLKSLLAKNIQQGTRKMVYTIFDEFSVFAGHQVVNLINQGRSAGVCAILATQSLADIMAKGGESLLGQVLNNCNNFIIQRQNNPRDANILADVIGEHGSYRTSFTRGDVAESATVTRTRELVICPDEIKKLQVGQAYVVKKYDSSMHKINVRQGVIAC